MHWSWTLLLVALVALATPTAAHGAPPPRDFETRVLADDNDDCGGDGATSVTGNCRGTHDLVAFNVREAYDTALGHVVVLTLVANVGAPEGQTLTDTFTYTAKGASRAIVFSTADDKTFSVAGAAKVVGPQALIGADGSPDGSRFTVDASFKRGDLGLSVGDRLQDFSVTARRGETRGDVMPGGYVTPLGTTTDGDDSTRYKRPFVELRGPVQYLRLTPQPTVTVEEGLTAFVNLQVRNLLSDMAQTVRYDADDTAHVRTGFHVIGSPSGTYPETMADAIPMGGTEDVHLAVTGVGQGKGSLVVTLSTDRGGLVTGQVAYDVVAAGSGNETSTGTPGGNGNGAPGGGGNDSPGLGAGLAMAVLLAMLAAVRRR